MAQALTQGGVVFLLGLNGLCSRWKCVTTDILLKIIYWVIDISEKTGQERAVSNSAPKTHRIVGTHGSPPLAVRLPHPLSVIIFDYTTVRWVLPPVSCTSLSLGNSLPGKQPILLGWPVSSHISRTLEFSLWNQGAQQTVGFCFCCFFNIPL